MLTYIQTPNHNCRRAPCGAYAIHNRRTNQVTWLNGRDAIALDVDLAGTTMRAIDSVLERHEAMS